MAKMATVNADVLEHALVIDPAAADLDNSTVTLQGGISTFEALAAYAVSMLWECQKAYNARNGNTAITSTTFVVNQNNDGLIRGSFAIPVSDVDPGAGLLSVFPGELYTDPA